MTGERIWRDRGYVHKSDPERLDGTWADQMQNIIRHWDNWNQLAFHTFLPVSGGYTTRFIDGTDLHGNLPFHDDEDTAVILPPARRFEVLRIFVQAMKVGKALGYTFGDITCGNLMVDDNGIYLIDYDVIVPWPLPESHVRVWNNTLRLLFGENQ
jgi:hypothetical protein